MTKTQLQGVGQNKLPKWANPACQSHAVVGLLAVLKAGGAYVPLDPAYPDERLRFGFHRKAEGRDDFPSGVLELRCDLQPRL